MLPPTSPPPPATHITHIRYDRRTRSYIIVYFKWTLVQFLAYILYFSPLIYRVDRVQSVGQTRIKFIFFMCCATTSLPYDRTVRNFLHFANLLNILLLLSAQVFGLSSCSDEITRTDKGINRFFVSLLYCFIIYWTTPFNFKLFTYIYSFIDWLVAYCEIQSLCVCCTTQFPIAN